jgi:hypothetical protein
MSNLTRVTVNLTPKAIASLKDSADREGLTRTEVANRAVQLYNLISERRTAGEKLVFLHPDTGALEEVYIL